MGCVSDRCDSLLIPGPWHSNNTGCISVNRSHIAPIFQALLAALFFGASAPFAKLLLGEIDPILLAALLYLGSGLGLLVVRAVQQVRGPSVGTEARLKNTDLLWLAGAILAGGIAAPIILLYSLRNTPAATASLLLNFEAVATTLIATFAFKEYVSRRAWGAIVAITLASILLSINPNSEWGLSVGAAGILAACALWGIDNNLTRNIAARNPLTIVTIKGLAAGACSLVLAMALGSRLPGWTTLLGAMILGSLSYGLSNALFIRAMRGLGAARTSALFGTAPLAGIGQSFLFLREGTSLMLWLAIPLVIAGTVLLVSENHSHRHLHEVIIHEHPHSHDDEQHKHDHTASELHAGSHSHPHEHTRYEHEHLHMPDIDHRHTHEAVDKAKH
jgi:drug/metabolite transporter (DMT)-like permease